MNCSKRYRETHMNLYTIVLLDKERGVYENFSS